MEFPCDVSLPFVESGHPMDSEVVRLVGITSVMELLGHRIHELDEVAKEVHQRTGEVPLQMILESIPLKAELATWAEQKLGEEFRLAMLFVCPECKRAPVREFLATRGYDVPELVAWAEGESSDGPLEVPHARMVEYVFALAYHHGRVGTEAVEGLMPECIREALADSAESSIVTDLDLFLKSIQDEDEFPQGPLPESDDDGEPYDWESGGDI